MVFVPLSIAPCYRPWRLSGIRHVLMSSASVQIVNDIMSPQKHAQPQRVVSEPEQSGHTRPEQGGHTQYDLSPARAIIPKNMPVINTASTAKTAPAHSPAQPPTPSSVQQTKQVYQSVQSPAHSKTAPNIAPNTITNKPHYKQWPMPWQERLTASAKQPLVVWSYAALTEDFSGKGNPDRADFVRRLYAGMALPKGSHVLWPLQLASDAEAQPDIFCAAMDILRPRLLVLLYDIVPEGLGIVSLACYQTVCSPALSGLPVLLGPSMEKLVADKAPLNPLLQIIRSMLGPLPMASRFE